jgi:hypothetical protein
MTKAPSPVKPPVVGAGSKVTQEFCLAIRRGSGIIAQTKCEINYFTIFSLSMNRLI